MTQYAFYFDQDICTGCKTCQVACKETYKLPAGNLYRRVLNYQGGAWERNEAGTYVPNGVFGYFVSVACNHCTDPACVENCPTGAMQKDPETGIVWTDHDACIGCKTCQTACPYNAPTFSEERGYMVKCDMCAGELERGRKPICVASCPMRALDFGPREELIEKYGDGDVEVEPLPQNTTDPNLILKPHREAQKSGSGTGEIVSLDEEL
ncbi:DMSO/selenate family reductase complex B subunit [Adlercreutzia sp. R25]|uniref:DMSO/selenate family reductase complex B subunit n=1 Tax=Adlercreutzia shanghongiae TaxID=3111773 RepID=UPI002DBA613D|nr:DMSO/selenate family reductase complex B subunit [Adlercreutzia sp. R25]MEC4271609.1 DMSO/selenate family reductase complex B subunit [Adlercreutzia sp. R25]